jgi:catechol 2,3-dioxygenase-like lactoylglutathione lyase family enzyme
MRLFPHPSSWVALVGLSLFAQASAQDQVRFVDLSASLGLELSGESAAWGDCNGDGWSDLLAGGQLWLTESGDRFKAAAKLPDGVLVDFDHDGDMDAASCGYESKRVMLYLNDSQGNFELHVLDDDQESYDLRSVDMDGDGDLDLLNAGRGSNNVSWYENPLK